MRRKKQSKGGIRRWHVDFRIPAQLPDIKIVRTDFAIVCGCILLPVLLSVVLLYHYLRVEESRDHIALLQRQVDQQAAMDTEITAMNRLFEQEAQKIQEVTLFLQQELDPVIILQKLIQLKPADIAYQNMSISEWSNAKQVGKDKTEIRKAVQIRLTGMLRGSSAEQLEQMDLLQRQIRRDSYFSALDLDMQLKVQRNIAADVFDFNLQITVQARSES